MLVADFPTYAERTEFYKNHALAIRRVSVQAVRVRDASVRKMALELSNICAPSPALEDPTPQFQKINDVFNKLQPRIGELLRTLDDEDIREFEAESGN
jgi:hypothetical protein